MSNKMQERKETTHIVIHCSDSNFGDVDQIRQWHKERGWLDIGYHFVILNGRVVSHSVPSKVLDGETEVGRDIAMVGSHCKAKGMNHVSIGVCLIGMNKFSKRQYKSLKKLVKKLQKKYKIPNENVIGHGEVDPNKICPCWNVGAFRDYLTSKQKFKNIFKG